MVYVTDNCQLWFEDPRRGRPGMGPWSPFWAEPPAPMGTGLTVSLVPSFLVIRLG